jgi:hypothetical protein
MNVLQVVKAVNVHCAFVRMRMHLFGVNVILVMRMFVLIAWSNAIIVVSLVVHRVLRKNLFGAIIEKSWFVRNVAGSVVKIVTKEHVTVQKNGGLQSVHFVRNVIMKPKITEVMDIKISKT